MDDPNAIMLDLDFCSFSLLPGNRVGKMHNGASAGFPRLPEGLCSNQFSLCLQCLCLSIPLLVFYMLPMDSNRNDTFYRTSKGRTGVKFSWKYSQHRETQVKNTQLFRI